MSALGPEREDQIIKALIRPDDDCVHNFAPLFELIAEIDRNARAYGWEVGHGHPLTEKIESTTPGNPFMDPDWRAHILPPEQCSGAIPTLSPPAERCTLPEGHDGPCQ